MRNKLFGLLIVTFLVAACAPSPGSVTSPPPTGVSDVPTSAAAFTAAPSASPLPTAADSSVDCSYLRSTRGSESTVITFVNSSGRDVDVYWVDYLGSEQFWFELPSGLTQKQTTYVTHGWCVRDKTSNTALLAVVASRVEQLATIALPASTVSLVLTPSPIPLDASNPTPNLTLGMILWAETSRMPIPSAAPFDSLRGQQLIFHNGYVYLFGGRNASNPRLMNVYFSAIRLDGTLAGWVPATSLPGAYYDHVVVKVGNYVYLLTGAAGVDDVYYAPFNPDGSIGTWKETASLFPSRQTFAAVSHGNFIYAAGGNSGGWQSFVQYASVKPDGSLNSWAYTTSLPVAIQEHTMIAYNDYLYVIGGRQGNGQWTNTIYFSAIQPDGTLADWEMTTPLPRKVSGFATFESNGYIYLLGNKAALYTRILEDHTLADWQVATSLPAPRQGLRIGANNSFAYAIGGNEITSFQDTVYYGGLGLQLSAESPIVDHTDCTSGWTRLRAGREAKVSEDNSLTNRVRLGPGTNEPIVARLYPGSIVKLIEGPICANGVVFWKVGSYPKGIGWTAEGDGDEYYLEPVR